MPTVAFDVIGTLFGLDRPRAALVSAGTPEDVLELWFAQSLRDAIAFSHAGGYRPFRDVLEAALHRYASGLPSPPGDDDLAAVMEAFGDLDPVAGAEEATAQFAEAGWRLVTLTNGSEDSTRALLRRAGIEGRFDEVLSCDAIGKTKPHPDVYRMAQEGAEGETWMVAAHGWDIAGAARAGLRTAWVSAVEGEYLSVYPRPDVTASDISAAAKTVIGQSTP
jgi:2-haloacid dehalogenase